MRARSLKMTFLCLLFACGAVTTSCGRKKSQGESTPPKPKTTFISIGTGGVTGVYYQVGGGLMTLVNRQQTETGIKASFQATGGSVYNINTVLAGSLEFGLAQSDRQHQAYHGLAEWKDAGPREALRVVCSVHPESVTLIAAADAGIKVLADLEGKRVNIGNPGSGNRGNSLDVLAAAGLDWEKDLHAESVKAAESSKLLQDGRIDAFFYTVGHPAGAITEATAGRRPVCIVPITNMQKLIAEHPYYAPTVIPRSLYTKATNEADIDTIGVMTTLITSADVPEDVVYAVTKSLFGGLDEFKTMHPAFAFLDPNVMVTAGLSAPIHPGALRYYREAGLLAPTTP